MDPIIVSPSQFATLQQKLAESHDAVMAASVDDNHGTITGHGVTATFAYDPIAQTLTIVVTKHPWYEPLGAIESAIKSNIVAALAS